MTYKDMPEYKDMLEMGYVDITNIYKSSKPTLVFQHKSQVGRDPENGDIRYVVQQSGYVRNPSYDRVSWNMNGHILDTFNAGLENFREVGLVLLATNLKSANGLIDKSEAYKARAQVKVKGIITYLFKTDWSSYYDRAFINALKGGAKVDDDFKKALDMINNPKKIYQGIVKLAKEIGI